MVSTITWLLMISLGLRLLAQLALLRTTHAASVLPRYDGDSRRRARRRHEARELVERAVEDQSREEVGRLERVADDVAEIAAAASAFLDDVVRAAGMHDHRHAELGGLGPEQVELRSERSSPFTWPPIDAPRRPRRLTLSSSCCAARSGNCNATEAIATNRSGCVLTHFARPSFCACTIFCARSRSAAYHRSR